MDIGTKYELVSLEQPQAALARRGCLWRQSRPAGAAVPLPPPPPASRCGCSHASSPPPAPADTRHRQRQLWRGQAVPGAGHGGAGGRQIHRARREGGCWAAATAKAQARHSWVLGQLRPWVVDQLPGAPQSCAAWIRIQGSGQLPRPVGRRRRLTRMWSGRSSTTACCRGTPTSFGLGRCSSPPRIWACEAGSGGGGGRGRPGRSSAPGVVVCCGRAERLEAVVCTATSRAQLLRRPAALGPPPALLH